MVKVADVASWILKGTVSSLPLILSVPLRKRTTESRPHDVRPPFSPPRIGLVAPSPGCRASADAVLHPESVLG